jgi:AcrR family transcriptional regulator
MRTKRRKAADLERIEAALPEVVSVRGWSGTTVEDVCARAEVTREAFDRAFSDIEDCYCAYLETQTATLLTRSAAVFEREESWRDQLRGVAFTLLDFLEEDRVRARVMMVETLAAGDRARLVRDQGMQALTLFVDAGRGELDDPESLSSTTAAAICGAIFSQILFEIERDNYENLRPLLPKLMYSAVLPYLGPDVAAEELQLPVPPRSDGVSAGVDIS